MIKKNIGLLVLVFLISCGAVNAQFTSKVTRQKDQAYKDSLQNNVFPYLLPIWGEKVQEKGFDIPYPAGTGLNFFWQRQDTQINNLAVSVGESGDIDISDLVVFQQIKSETYSLSFRPDVYIFPFLNVYGIVNYVNSRTNVVLSEPFELVIPEVSNEGVGGGFGMSLAGGIGPAWVAANINFAWTKIRNLERPTPSVVSAIRVGGTKRFNSRNRFLAFWVGVNYQNYNSDNRGSYDLTQLFPDEPEKLQELQEQFQMMADGANEKYSEWCMMPGNGPKCMILDPVFEEVTDRIQDKIDGIDPPDELRIGYAFNAEPAKKWNMLAGVQFHISRRWQTRFEAGFLGARTTYLISGNYRFGFVRRKS